MDCDKTLHVDSTHSKAVNPYAWRGSSAEAEEAAAKIGNMENVKA